MVHANQEHPSKKEGSNDAIIGVGVKLLDRWSLRVFHSDLSTESAKHKERTLYQDQPDERRLRVSRPAGVEMKASFK